MRDKEQYDMQIHKRVKDRPRAIHYSHQFMHFDHRFAHNSSHKYCKENNKQKHQTSQGKGEIRWKWHLLECDESNARKMTQRCRKKA